MPTALISLDQFEEIFSKEEIFGKKDIFIMQLADEGKLYVASTVTGKFLPTVTLEWYQCLIGDSPKRGGRRLLTAAGDTIHWQVDRIISY